MIKGLKELFNDDFILKIRDEMYEEAEYISPPFKVYFIYRERLHFSDAHIEVDRLDDLDKEECLYLHILNNDFDIHLQLNTNITYYTFINLLKIENLMCSTELLLLLMRIYKSNKIAQRLVEEPLCDISKHRNIVLKEDGKFSYLPAGREGIVLETDYAHTNRLIIKPGRLIKKLYGDDYNEKEVEEFVNILKAATNAEDEEFKIISGEDIRKWYDVSTYAVDQNTLTKSCMRHSACQPYFDLYVDNPDLIKMLILINADNDLIGRALLWKINDITFMDRIYGTDITIQKFINYAKKEGYIYKERQSYDNDYFIDKNNNIFYSTFNIPINIKKYDKFPYLDTFFHATNEGLFNFTAYNCTDNILEYLKNNKKNILEVKTLRNTEGRYSSHFYYVLCESCGKLYNYSDKDNIITSAGKYYCNHCMVNDYFTGNLCKKNETMKVYIYNKVKNSKIPIYTKEVPKEYIKPFYQDCYFLENELVKCDYSGEYINPLTDIEVKMGKRTVSSKYAEKAAAKFKYVYDFIYDKYITKAAMNKKQYNKDFKFNSGDAEIDQYINSLFFFEGVEELLNKKQEND